MPATPPNRPRVIPYVKGSLIPKGWAVIAAPWTRPTLLAQGSRIPIFLPSSSGGLLVWDLPEAEGRGFYAIRSGLKTGIFTDW